LGALSLCSSPVKHQHNSSAGAESAFGTYMMFFWTSTTQQGLRVVWFFSMKNPEDFYSKSIGKLPNMASLKQTSSRSADAVENLAQSLS
jgi:hypothetical protein